MSAGLDDTEREIRVGWKPDKDNQTRQRRKEIKMALVTGNTYPVKNQLRSLGGKWNPEAKGWEVPDEKLAEAMALVANAPKKQQRGDENSTFYPRKKKYSRRECSCDDNGMPDGFGKCRRCGGVC